MYSLCNFLNTNGLAVLSLNRYSKDRKKNETSEYRKTAD